MIQEISLPIRNKPYPPNFNKTPAKIIEPETGASTWAFGSHRWNKYKGIFTMKAIMKTNHHILIKPLIISKNSNLKNINKLPLLERLYKMPQSRGSEAHIVYIIKYKPACKRSGW